MLNQYLDETKIEVGIDEAGRGCLFGPVCVAAVVWPDEDPPWYTDTIPEIKDSKKLSEKKRILLKEYIEDKQVQTLVNIEEIFTHVNKIIEKLKNSQSNIEKHLASRTLMAPELLEQLTTLLNNLKKWISEVMLH